MSGLTKQDVREVFDEKLEPLATAIQSECQKVDKLVRGRLGLNAIELV